MRITPLHNIRQQGLIPNGFQKEEAPPPTPDHALQPGMRNRVEAPADTRHALELLNPRAARLEVNGTNRTNSTFPANIEMGRQRPQPVNPEGRGNVSQPAQDDAHARLLRILLGREHSNTPSATPTASHLKSAAHHQSVASTMHPGSVAYHQAAALDALLVKQPVPFPGNMPTGQDTAENYRLETNYYLRRGIEAYRRVLSFAREDSITLQA